MPRTLAKKNALAAKAHARKSSLAEKAQSRAKPARAFPWHWVVLFTVMLLCGFIRFRLRDTPLERDEGEYAYAGQLMLQGIPPYKLAYNMKLPGTYAGYAAIEAIFGQTSAGIHVGLLLVNAVTIVMVFLLGLRLWGNLAGACAGVTYALFSLSPSVVGMAAHATHFVVLAATGGLLLLLSAIERDSLPMFFASGSCLGLAFLMKQPGLVYFAFAATFFIYCAKVKGMDWRRVTSRTGTMLAGFAWPFLLTCVVMLWAGVFRTFAFWTISYARVYAFIVPFQAGMLELREQAHHIFFSAPLLWIMAGLGLGALILHRFRSSQAMFVGGLLAFSAVGVAGGLHFRDHYFVLLLPVAALLCGFAVEWATDLVRRRQSLWLRAAPAIVCSIAFAASFVHQREWFFPSSPIAASQLRYPGNPFVEAREIGEYLRNNTPPGTRIAVIGSEPEIYFYSRRLSATGYVYMYPLMEDQKYALQMQHEMKQELAKSRPEYVVFVDDSLSWLWQPGPSDQFLAIVQQYLNTFYKLKARVDVYGEADHLLDDVPRLYLYSRTKS